MSRAIASRAVHMAATFCRATLMRPRGRERSTSIEPRSSSPRSMRLPTSSGHRAITRIVKPYFQVAYPPGVSTATGSAIQENEPACAILCPEIIAAARTAAEVVGLRLAGVDVICRDPSLPLAASGGAIIEVNAPPFLYYHHLEGRDVSVAAMILKAYLEVRREASTSPTQ